MTEWIKGNMPPFSGLFWVTINKDGSAEMLNYPLRYENGKWSVYGKGYPADRIIAWVKCNKPSSPYDENHIGYPDQYYLKITGNGDTRYLSKGLQSINWSKIGYSTKEKAVAAMKRYIKTETEQGYVPGEIVIVNGKGEEV